MKAFVLKLKSDKNLYNNIKVVKMKQPDVVVRTLSEHDEIMKTTEDDEEYSWFIVSNSDDEVIYINGKKWQRYETIQEGVKDTIYVNRVPEFYSKAIKNGTVVPDIYLTALKTALQELFKCPVFSAPGRSWNSVSIFTSKYVSILKAYDKKLGDFISETIISTYIRTLMKYYAIEELRGLLNSELIDIPDDVRDELKDFRREVDFIRNKAFLLFDKKSELSSNNESLLSIGNKNYKIRIENAHFYLVINTGKELISESLGYFDFE